jgi:hypothetical protein
MASLSGKSISNQYYDIKYQSVDNSMVALKHDCIPLVCATRSFYQVLYDTID